MGSAAKDVGYGLSHKLGHVADSAKNLMGGGDSYGSYGQRMKPKKGSWLGSKLWGSGGEGEQESTGWFGGHDQHQQQRGGSWMGEHDDEFELATQKLRNVAREADRQL